MTSHTAVLLIALGGPRSLDEVGPFMTAFMGRPAPPPVVQAVIERYELIGGKSPLPQLVQEQADALAKKLGHGFRVYEGFRYSSPTIEAAYDRAVREGANRVIGLSMSPFATEVTTGAYQTAFEALGGENIKKIFIPSWHDNPLFISAWQEKVNDAQKCFRETQRRNTVVIFTSHSIPLRYVTAGDPIRSRSRAVKLVAEGIGIKEWRIAWQSKGARATEPWLEPAVERVLDRVSAEKFGYILEVPIGFTCDHMETLYDIDIVHRKYAAGLGLIFERVSSLNTSPLFVKALADIVKKAL
jgi:ferrochelatase